MITEREILTKDIKRLLLRVYRRYQTGTNTEAQAHKDTYPLNSVLNAIEITDLRDYDDPPHVVIDLNGFDFMRHTRSCKDCNSFFDALKSKSEDWLMDFNGKKYFIRMNDLGIKKFGKNQIKMTQSEYNFGTRIQIEILKLDKLELDELELNSVEMEDYEGACLYRDLKKEV
jgi:hypothetical protein